MRSDARGLPGPETVPTDHRPNERGEKEPEKKERLASMKGEIEAGNHSGTS